MNKKQAGIIVTLLALIVCAGILAARVNGPLSVSTMENSGVFNLNNDKKTDKATTTSDYFVSARLERDQNDGKVLAQYQALIQDKNVSAQSKKEAEAKHLSKTNDIDHENAIEINLKASGFADAICLITDDKARVIVKGTEVSDKQRKQIQDIVMKVAKIKEVEIQAKQ